MPPRTPIERQEHTASGAERSACEALHPARPLEPPRRPHRAMLHLRDGYRTSVYIHRREDAPPRLPVLYAHGIQSHPGWFVGSAAAMADRGHVVFQVTRRGSGGNCIDRGHARSGQQLLDDLDTARDFALARAHAERLHLVGVSWGGKLVTAYAAQPARSACLASMSLVAPGIAARVDVPGRTKLAIACSFLLAPKRRFDIPLSAPELFTDHEPMREYLRKDPLALHQATAQFMMASRSLDRQLHRTRRGAVTTPTTLILASRDRIIDNDKTRAIVDRLTGNAATVEILQSAHVLEFEPDPRPLYDALLAALDRAE